MAWHVGPAGVQEQGISAPGFSRNLRDPIVSTAMAGRGYRLTNPRPAWSVSPRGSEIRHGSVVAPSEGNEVRRDGRWEVGAPHSTCEPGELGPREPGGGSAARLTVRLAGASPASA